MPDFPFNLGDVLGVIPGIGGGLERIYDVVAGGGRGSIPGGAVGQGLAGGLKWPWENGNGNGAVTRNGMCPPLYAPVTYEQRAVAPPGMVVVTNRDGSKIAMEKQAAIRCKKYSRPSKPPIKASDWRCLRRAAAVNRRIDSVVKIANSVTGKNKLRRVASKRC